MRVWMLMLLVGGCAPDKAGETGETGETGDSGETGETGLDDGPAVEFEYFPTYEGMFAEACGDVVVDGASVPIDVDTDGVVDCGRADGDGVAANIVLTAMLPDKKYPDKWVVADEHPLTASELTAAVQAVVGKATNRSQVTLSFQDSCSAVCDAMFASTRKGTCPEYRGSAVAASNNALTEAMNSLQTQLATSLRVSLDGSWCWVSTREEDLVANTGVTQVPVNIWWGVIYGLRNYSAGSVVFPGGDYAPTAIYGLSYKVPGKVANQYAAFLANNLTDKYPPGSSFTLVPQTAKYSADGVTTTGGGWPSWWTTPTGTGIIDPVFTYGEGDLLVLDTFIAAHAGIKTNAVFGTEGDCPTSDAFPWDDPSSLTGDPTHNNETISLDPECPEAP